MAILSDSEELLLRTYPQETSLYLSIYQPTIAFQCQVSGTYDANNQTVSYDNVTSGSYSNIISYAMQVALIGSTAGDDDIGRTWVRSATASSMRFVESDHINWADNLYITVLNYTEIIPVFPRIVQDDYGSGTVTFYKIWDVEYTDQNEILGNFVNMGSHYAGWVGDNVYWDASGTININNGLETEPDLTTRTFIWELEGGTPSYVSGTATPGNVLYSTPGHYRTKLTITNSEGENDVGFRYVSIYDKPGEGSKPPFTDWSLLQLSGSFDANGWTCRVRVRQNVPQTILMDNALVIVWGEDRYGSTDQSMPKGFKGRNKIRFIGYVDGDTIQQNYQDKFVEFSAMSPTKIMELCECFSVSVESKRSPTTWYELKDMTVMKAIYHYLRWHSTVSMCMDIYPRFDDQFIQYFDSDRTSLYDAINALMDGAMVGHTVCDRLGAMWLFRHPNVIENRLTNLVESLSITKADWIGDPVIDERQNRDVSFIEMGGIAFEITGSSSIPYLSAAPGISPAYHGTVERIQGLALEDQNDLNRISGDLYAHKVARFPRSEFRLRMTASHLDIALPTQFKVTMAAEDTPRGYVWSEKPFFISSINEMWNPKDQIEIYGVSLHEFTQGYVGDTVVIPVVPPDITTNVTTTHPPKPPDPPGWPPIDPPVNTTPGVIDAVVAIAGDVRTGDILSETPTWTTEY